MEIKEIIGYSMALIPFALIFVFSARANGLKETAMVFGGVAFVAIWFALAGYLTS